MAYVPEDDSRLRRRRKFSVWFTDGQDDAAEEKEKVKTAAAGAKRYFRYAWPPLRVFLAASAVMFLTLVSVGLALRMLGFACKHVPFAMPYCKRPSIAMQESLVDRLPPGTTPLTKFFEGLTEVNDLSPSLEFVGLAMHLVAVNISDTVAELQKHSEMYQIPQDHLTTFSSSAQSSVTNVNRFHQSDYYYRHSDTIWGRNGIHAIGVKTDVNLGHLNSTGFALLEHILHRTPGGVTLAAQCMNDYFFFAGEQDLALDGLVRLIENTTRTLDEFSSSLAQLHGELEAVAEKKSQTCVSAHTGGSDLCSADPSNVIDRTQDMRVVAQWVQNVIKLAERQYRYMHSEVHGLMHTLDREVKSYSAWFPSKSALSFRRLQEFIKAERAQISAFAEKQGEVEKLVDGLNKQLLDSKEANHEVVEKWERALREGTLREWWL